jgi:serine/threonine-protein kinase RsbW
MAQLHNLSLPCALRPAPFIELQQCLPSRIAAISPFVDRFIQFLEVRISKLGDADEDEVDIRIALSEALTNAVIHGNRENLHKCVYVTCRLSMDREVLLTVRDEGAGFDLSAIPDPTDRHNRLLPTGRGIYLMRAFMDEVCFEENGKVVHLRKRLRRQERGSNGRSSKL